MKRFTGYFRSRDIFFFGSKDVPHVNSLHSFTCCVLAYLCKRFRKCENFLSFTSLPTEIFELPGTGHNCYSSQHMFTTVQSYIHRIVDIIHIPPLSILSMDSVFLFSHLHFPIPTSTAPTIPHPPKTPNRTPVPTFISANPLDRPMLAVRRKKMVTLSSTKADTKAMVNTQNCPITLCPSRNSVTNNWSHPHPIESKSQRWKQQHPSSFHLDRPSQSVRQS